MSDDNLNHIEDLFHAVIELRPRDREPYLARVCDGNNVLYQEVSSLVAAFESKGEFFEQPAIADVFKVITHSSEQSLIGRTIGPYEILCLLGKGGMGEVYLADDTKLQRKVALKFISQEYVGDSWARRRLFREGQAAAQLDHPNICDVYDIVEHDEQIFIVMQYVEGQTLSDVIKQEVLSEDRIVLLSTQIVSALAAAHLHGIIHRDVKPRNIMITPQGGVKVLDFGLAKNIHQAFEPTEDSISLLSKTGLVPGTVAYMSPEQLRGERLDYRSDIFSVGIVISEMINGKNPFARENLAETISAILTNQIDPSPKSTHSLEAIVSRCLHSEPDDRYQSTSELLLDLESPKPKVKKLSSFAYLMPLMVLLVILSFVIVSLINRKPRTVRVAVLPIVAQTSDVTDSSTGDGLTETLISRLSRVPNLNVSGFTIGGYRDYSDNSSNQGARLSVDAVLVGRLTRQGNVLTLSTELFRTDDWTRLWAEQYNIEGNEILFAEDKIAQTVSSRLRTLDPDKHSLSLSQTTNPEAFREYLTGRYYWKKRDKENIPKAIECFQRSVALDPAYALAYTGLADSYVVMTTVAYGSIPTRDAMTKAKAYAKQALEIDPQSCEAHTALAVVYLKYDWDWTAAEIELKRAIELKPDYAAAHYWYGELLSIVGRFDEAIRETEAAKELDPISTIANMAPGRAYYRARRFDMAMDYLKKTLTEDPNNESAKYVLGYVYLQKGMYPEALDVFQRAYSNDPLIGAAPLGYLYGKLNRRDDAEKILATLREYSQKQNVPPIELAIIYIGLGDQDEAFSWLEKAYKDRFASLVYLSSDPIFSDLRSDPRFSDLCRRMNLAV